MFKNLSPEEQCLHTMAMAAVAIAVLFVLLEVTANWVFVVVQGGVLIAVLAAVKLLRRTSSQQEEFEHVS
jgi:membrane protein implicated in regulation of membrane protease activity